MNHSLTLNASPQQVQLLSDNIDAFIKEYPTDSLASHYLFELSRVHQSRGDYKKALATLEQLEQKYPDAKETGMSVFMQGFIYANSLNELEKAKQKYKLYLQKFSAQNEKMTHDVKLELANLGKSADEIFNSIQQKADSGK